MEPLVLGCIRFNSYALLLVGQTDLCEVLGNPSLSLALKIMQQRVNSRESDYRNHSLDSTQ